MVEELNNYLYILPILYIGLFIIFTYLKNKFPNFLDKNNPFFCTVCSAFATALIIGFIAGYPSIVLIYLTGISITGISVKLDQYLFYFKKMDYPGQFFIIQLILTMGGMFIIFKYLI